MELAEKQLNSSDFSMKASKSQFFGVNAFALIFGIILLNILLKVRGIFSLKLFLLSIVIIVIYLFIDSYTWLKKGIREVRLTKDGIQLFRGKFITEQFIPYTKISDINMHQRSERMSLQILLKHKVQRIPGIFTYYPGPKIWLTNDAFDNAAFTEFYEKLKDNTPHLNH